MILETLPETSHTNSFLLTDANDFSKATNLALAGKKRVRLRRSEISEVSKNIRIAHKVREELGESGRQYLLRPSEMKFCLEPRFSKPEEKPEEVEIV
jgi:hypothetical protein